MNSGGHDYNTVFRDFEDIFGGDMFGGMGGMIPAPDEILTAIENQLIGG